jgi:hypothetical protein
MTRTLAILALVVAAITGAQAHHSSAMYDQEKTLTLRGVVTQLRWTSPHVNVSVLADPGRGQAGVAWVLEAEPGQRCAGWTRPSIKVGDRVSVLVAPLLTNARRVVPRCHPRRVWQEARVLTAPD